MSSDSNPLGNWVVGNNDPGCLPENMGELYEFDVHGEAIQCLMDEAYDWATHDAEMAETEGAESPALSQLYGLPKWIRHFEQSVAFQLKGYRGNVREFWIHRSNETGTANEIRV